MRKNIGWVRKTCGMLLSLLTAWMIFSPTSQALLVSRLHAHPPDGKEAEQIDGYVGFPFFFGSDRIVAQAQAFVRAAEHRCSHFEGVRIPCIQAVCFR